jgi:hypothetical protein
MKNFMIAFFLVLLFIAFPALVYTWSFSAFTSMAGEGELGFLPAAIVSLTPMFDASGEMIISYGFTPNVDINIDPVIVGISPSLAIESSWIMPRYDFGNNNIIGLQFMINYASPLSYDIIPQYHYYLERDVFALEVNAAADVSLSSSPTRFYGVFAPVWKAIPGNLYLFLETDPSYILGNYGGFALDVIPGLSFRVPGTQTYACVGLTFHSVTSGSLNFGLSLWYAAAFDTKESEKQIY